jgi:hypothetical protein
MYLKALAIFWLLANLVSTPSRLRVTAMTLIVCSVPLAVTGVKNFLTGNFAGGDNPVLRITGYQNALAQNPNDLALMLNLILPLAIAVFLGAVKPMIRLAALGIIGVSAVSVVLTFSRGGFLGLATIGLIYVARLVRAPGSDRALGLRRNSRRLHGPSVSLPRRTSIASRRSRTSSRIRRARRRNAGRRHSQPCEQCAKTRSQARASEWTCSR